MTKTTLGAVGSDSAMKVHHTVFSVSLEIILKTGPNPDPF